MSPINFACNLVDKWLAVELNVGHIFTQQEQCKLCQCFFGFGNYFTFKLKKVNIKVKVMLLNDNPNTSITDYHVQSWNKKIPLNWKIIATI